MKWNRFKQMAPALGAAAVLGYGAACRERGGAAEAKAERTPVKAVLGTVRSCIEANGSVEPRNRLELTPPISGRLESVLVREGERVRRGQVVAWMSSSDRAALIDAALAGGLEEASYWQEVYKPTAIVAPIDGEVIVRACEPGQSLTPGKAVVVLSDRLIVKARVDETDTGRVREGQPAEVTLDAYPEIHAAGAVGHIAYEARVVNNVTLYEVEILIERLPEVFRAGMNAQVKIWSEVRENAVVVPEAAVRFEGAEAYVEVRSEGRTERRRVETGLVEGGRLEVRSGLRPGEEVLAPRTALVLEADRKKNPFMPSRQRGGNAPRTSRGRR